MQVDEQVACCVPLTAKQRPPLCSLEGVRMAQEMLPCLVGFPKLQSHHLSIPNFQVLPSIAPGGSRGGAALDDKPEEIADELPDECGELPPIAGWSPRMTRKP